MNSVGVKRKPETPKDAELNYLQKSMSDSYMLTLIPKIEAFVFIYVNKKIASNQKIRNIRMLRRRRRSSKKRTRLGLPGHFRKKNSSKWASPFS